MENIWVIIISSGSVVFVLKAVEFTEMTLMTRIIKINIETLYGIGTVAYRIILEYSKRK